MKPTTFPEQHPVLNIIAVASLLMFMPMAYLLYGATFPSGFVQTTIASGLSQPTAMAFSQNGRLFVCLQGGTLRVVRNDTLLPAPFVSLTVNSSGERGLIGVAVDPNFTTNHYIYLYYTATSPTIHNRVSRFTANGDVVLAGSELVLLNLNDLSSATNHNGGAMHFGLDGKLYIAVGENANGSNSQTLSNMLGKLLRINSDGTIPTDNPFYGTATGNNRSIWARGLRNPFTFNIQPGTGRILINDVGENTWEEINDGLAGANYGWPTHEGVAGDINFKDPLLAYDHGAGCAITGGAFYNPQLNQFPATYVGKYFYTDYCTGWIRYMNPSTGTWASWGSGIGSPVDIAISSNGSLYYLARSGGTINRVQYPSGLPIQLSSFSAQQIGSHVLVEWTTLSELNNYGFYVQRRVDSDTSFTTLPDFIPGHGTTIVPQYYSLIDYPPAGSWWYRLQQIDLDGTIHLYDAVHIDVLTDASEDRTAQSFSLRQNFPNPFNSLTRITFSVGKQSLVTITLHNLLGNTVKMLTHWEYSQGEHTLEWNADDLPTGLYICKMVAGQFTETKKMILLK